MVIIENSSGTVSIFDVRRDTGGKTLLASTRVPASTEKVRAVLRAATIPPRGGYNSRENRANAVADALRAANLA